MSKAEVIRNMRRDGSSIDDICNAIDYPRHEITRICREAGMPATESEKAKSKQRQDKKHTHNEVWARQYISEKSDGRLEYVSGYISMDGHVFVRCTHCGCEQERAFSSFRSCKNTLCKICKYHPEEEIKREEKRKEKERRKQLKEVEKETQRLVKAGRGEQMSLRFCECGEIINGRAACCKRCTNRNKNKYKEVSRRIKIKGALVDSDISVLKLFKRDSGICYLCGGLCDVDDKIEKDGTIICGDMYPSIDHVIPLARGGKHSWENVKLAHRICNTLKADKTA